MPKYKFANKPMMNTADTQEVIVNCSEKIPQPCIDALKGVMGIARAYVGDADPYTVQLTVTDFYNPVEIKPYIIATLEEQGYEQVIE